MSALVWLAAIGLGGAGAIVRAVLTQVIDTATGTEHFPWGTLVINLSGAFLLGLLVGLVGSTGTQQILGGGALSAYTTFSTWMTDTHKLATDKRHLLAVMNILISLLGGLGAVGLGRALGG